MTNFIKDVKELQEAYLTFKSKSELFDLKYRDHFYSLIDRYESATGGYIEKDISGLVSFEEDCFEIEKKGYEGSWLKDYPLELLTDPEYLVSLEAKKAEKDRLRFEENRRQEILKLEALKAKYE